VTDQTDRAVHDRAVHDRAVHDRDVSDRLDLAALVSRYALAVDRRDRAEIAAVFVADAVLSVADAGEPAGRRVVAEGGDTIAGFIMSLGDPGGGQYPGPTAHVIGAHVSTVTGDAATGETRCVAHHVTLSGNELELRTSYLRYVDTFVRTGDGWKFGARTLHRDFAEVRPYSGTPYTGTPDAGPR